MPDWFFCWAIWNFEPPDGFSTIASNASGISVRLVHVRPSDV